MFIDEDLWLLYERLCFSGVFFGRPLFLLGPNYFNFLGRGFGLEADDLEEMDELVAETD